MCCVLVPVAYVCLSYYSQKDLHLICSYVHFLLEFLKAEQWDSRCSFQALFKSKECRVSHWIFVTFYPSLIS